MLGTQAVAELSREGKELYAPKCAAVYHHVYESYYGEGRRVYSVAA